MSPLPAPDPAEGEAAEAAANKERDEAVEALSGGSYTLAELFENVDKEGEHHVLGHMHVRAALLALPGIGDVKADAILSDLGIEGSEHLDVLGSDERAAIIEAATSA